MDIQQLEGIGWINSVIYFEGTLFFRENKVPSLILYSVQLNYFFAVKALIPKSVATIRTIAMGNAMNALGTKPAIMYATKDTAATVRA